MKESTFEQHLLFISPAFRAGEKDSHVLVYFNNYLRSLKSKYPNVSISILSLHYPFEATNYELEGIKVYALGGNNKSIIHKPFLWSRALKLAHKIHREQSIDAIHSLWLRETTLLAQWLGKKFGIQPVATIMGTEIHERNPYLKYLKLDKLSIVSVSPFIDHAFRQKFPQASTTIIPWGVESKTNLRTDRVYDLLFVANQRPLKKFGAFLEIVKLIHKKQKGITIAIVGSFNDLEKWDAKIKALGFSQQVNLFGMKTNEEVLDIMGNSKILVHTSDFESQGYAMLEALSMGMMVVSKQVGIAEAGINWKICNSQKEFVEAIEKGLVSKLEVESFVPNTIEETVDGYVGKYFYTSK